MSAQLRFTVRNQHISRIDSFHPVKKSKNYLKAHFDFKTSDWEGVAASAIFAGKGIDPFTMLIDASGDCVVPWEVLECDSFNVSVFGGDLITVDSATVALYETGYTDGETPTEPTETVYSQIMDELAAQRSIVQSVRDDANNGEFDGFSPEIYEDESNTDDLYRLNITTLQSLVVTPNLKGAKGEKGDKGIDGITVPVDGMWGFEIDSNGHLLVAYSGDTAPDLAINDNGHLILNV